NYKQLPIAPNVGPVVFFGAACFNNNFAHEFAESFIVIKTNRASSKGFNEYMAPPIKLHIINKISHYNTISYE
ncbi:MAG: hypothetical protein KKH97_05040, partial [Proteobacteria bacterium]|nr:hypothetical protein [Pseudomonadota bacterium]